MLASMRDSDLEGIPLFADLAPEELARVAAVARPLHWDSGHVALREGEFAFDLYAIKQGAAEVHRGGRRVATLGAGDFFGELGVTRAETGGFSRRRTASVIVTEATDVIAIDGGAVRDLAAEIPKLGAALREAAETHRRHDSS
jgi:CRP-like cAMP-binding protein